MVVRDAEFLFTVIALFHLSLSIASLTAVVSESSEGGAIST
jgi:hypothetical protein